MSSILFLTLLLSGIMLACDSNKDCPTACCINSVCGEYSRCTYLYYRQYCANNHSCMSGYCNSNKCDVMLQNRCTQNSSCQSNCCYKGYCTPTSYCLSLKEEGEPCTCDCECINFICYSNYCDKKATGLTPISSACSFHDECISGCCDSVMYKGVCVKTHQCKFNDYGASCSSNVDCAGNLCTDGYCSQTASLTSSRSQFVLIGLPIIGACCIAIGIVLMCTVLRKHMANGVSISPFHKQEKKIGPNDSSRKIMNDV